MNDRIVTWGDRFSYFKIHCQLWLGFSPYKSGVYSAGNRAVMRSSIIGTYFADNFPKIIKISEKK